MPQRPFVTGLLAVGITATALRVAGGPAPSLSHALGSSAAKQLRPTHPTPDSAFEKLSWSEQLKQNPEAAGKLAAQKELQEKICGFVSLSSSACPPAPNPEAPSHPMYT